MIRHSSRFSATILGSGLLMGLILVGYIPHSWAADVLRADPCLVVPEEIIPLLPPNLEQSAMWKKTLGVQGEDRPRALLSVVDGGQIAIGESRIYAEKTGFADRQIEIIRTDKKGKILINKNLPIKNLQAVVDAVLLKDKIVVLTQIGAPDAPPQLVLQFLNGIGEWQESHELLDSGRSLMPKSLTVAQGGNKLVIAALSVSSRNADDFNTVVFWTDISGKEIMKRAYLPGIRNKPEYIGRLQNGTLAVAGRVFTPTGREVGWLMKLASNGDIIFQRPYARGSDSILRSAVPSGTDDIIVVGDTIPNAAGDKAGWIMKITSGGNIEWQKYITGKYSYSGIDLVTLPDGRTNVLVAGKPTTYGGREHARILTFSQTGQLIGDEAYLEGSNSIPYRFVAQNGLRYILGTSQTSVSGASAQPDGQYITYDLWLVGIPAMPLYQDPCGKGPERSLDDLP